MLEYKAKKLIFSSITRSRFANCPLIWMFCTKYCTSRTNRVGEDGCTSSHNTKPLVWKTLKECKWKIKLANMYSNLYGDPQYIFNTI